MLDDTDAIDMRIERQSDPAGAHSKTWKQTLEDMQAIADDRRSDGWEVTTIMAAHTDTVSRDMGEDDEFGLVHIIPNNYADAFTETFDAEAFTEYLAYGTELQKYFYLVTELIDPGHERSILIASRYDTLHAEGMVTSAKSAGVLYTHVKTIDGTILGTFEHESYGPLLGQPEA